MAWNRTPKRLALVWVVYSFLNTSKQEISRTSWARPYKHIFTFMKIFQIISTPALPITILWTNVLAETEPAQATALALGPSLESAFMVTQKAWMMPGRKPSCDKKGNGGQLPISRHRTLCVTRVSRMLMSSWQPQPSTLNIWLFDCPHTKCKLQTHSNQC